MSETLYIGTWDVKGGMERVGLVWTESKQFHLVPVVER